MNESDKRLHDQAAKTMSAITDAMVRKDYLNATYGAARLTSTILALLSGELTGFRSPEPETDRKAR